MYPPPPPKYAKLQAKQNSDLANEVLDLLDKTVQKDLPEYADAHWHVKRYAHSIKCLQEHDICVGTVFEGGGKGFSTTLLSHYFPECDVFHSERDLRTPLEFEDNTFDAVLLMEVLEHISDPLGGREISFDGLAVVLTELHRILKWDGKLFLTTPNASGALSLERSANNRHPFMYGIHVREYTQTELAEIFTLAGFSVDYIGAEFVWINPEDTAFAHHGGDDIFMIVSKKAACTCDGLAAAIRHTVLGL